MCQHLVHYNIYYLGLHDYMIRVVCWSFFPPFPVWKPRMIRSPPTNPPWSGQGGSKPAIQLLYHFLKTFIISSVNLLKFFNIVSLLNI